MIVTRGYGNGSNLIITRGFGLYIPRIIKAKIIFTRELISRIFSREEEVRVFTREEAE